MQTPDIFDNNRKFIFSNWTDEDFTGIWGGENTLIKQGETKEFEMSLAYHFAKHLVDREMSKAGKSNLLGVPEERAPYEDKTIAEVTAGTDSPALASLKAQIKAEYEKANDDLNLKEEAPKKVTKKTNKKDKEFADLK